MNSKKTLFFAIAVLLISLSIAYSTVTEPNLFRYSEILGPGQYNDTDIPITNVNVIGFVCSSAKCATVSDALDLSNGIVVPDENNPPVRNSGSSDSLSIVYPTELHGFGYGIYFYKDGYIPYEGNVTFAGNGNVPQVINYLSKKKMCSAPIENFTVLNDVQAYMPLIVDVVANLSADTLSAIKSAGPLEYVPPMLASHYSVNTSVRLDIKNSADTIVKTETKYVLINYSGSAHVSFSWTPTVNGTYTATVTTGIPDAKCISYETRTASAGFTVWPTSPRNECYTLLDGLRISPPTGAPVGQQINFTYNKISNYANDTFPSDPNYLKPIATRATYTIYNSTNNAVFSSTAILPKNPDSTHSAVQKFFWTPASIGQYWINITAIADDPLCAGKNNPEASIASSTFGITDTTPPKILSIYPANGSEVHSDSFEMSATTDESAICKYSTTDTDYVSMPNTFATTGTTVHKQALTLADGEYTYYMRCIDPSGNANTASNKTSFTVLTAARIEITASNVKVNQTDIFSLPILLNNTGFKNATGNLTIDIPAGLNISSGSTFIPFNIAPGAPQTYTTAIEAVMWGDYYINLTARYNNSTVKKPVLVQSTPIPIYEFRFASPDSLVVGDDTEVIVGLYNRGIVNGYNLPVSISTSQELGVVGDSQKIVPQVLGNNTDFVNSTYVTFIIKGLYAGSGTINVTIDGKTQTKNIIVRSAPLRIDLSVDALAPLNMSLGRLFKVTGVIYNTGSEPVSAVTSIELDTGLKNMSQILFDLGSVPRTVNGVPPVMREWVVNGTESGFKQMNISVKYPYYNGTDWLNGEIKDMIYVNILQFPEPVAPFIDIIPAYSPTIIFGSPFTINATLKNIGNDVAYNTVAAIENIGSLTVISTNPPSLNLGDLSRDSKTNITWTINATQTGTYNAIISATPIGHRFEEGILFSVVYPHDVSIFGMNAPATATEGSTVTVSAILKNIGASNENDVPVIFSVDGAAAQTKYYNISIGENKTSDFNWIAVVGTHTLSLYANLTSDGDDSNNNASIIISVSPIAQPPIIPAVNGGGNSGGGGSGGVSAYRPQDNKNAYFSNMSVPDSIIHGETLWVSGCIAKLGKNGTVEMFLDGDSLALKNASAPSTCFKFSAGVPAIGIHQVYLWLNGTNIDFTKSVNVTAKAGEVVPSEAGVSIIDISANDSIIEGNPIIIRVFVRADKEIETSLQLFSDGIDIGKETAIINGQAVFSFKQTFANSGIKTIKAVAKTSAGENVMIKKIDVKKAMPTGGLLSSVLKNPAIAALIAAIIGAGYYAYRKGYHVAAKARISGWLGGSAASAALPAQNKIATKTLSSLQASSGSPGTITAANKENGGVYLNAIELGKK